MSGVLISLLYLWVLTHPPLTLSPLLLPQQSVPLSVGDRLAEELPPGEMINTYTLCFSLFKSVMLGEADNILLK